MRLKLMFLVSLIGAIIGSGIVTLINFLVYGSLALANDPGITHRLTTGQLIALIPIVISVAAGVFVYRHTSRRRKLQAVLTAVLVLFFSWVLLIASWLLL